MSDFELSVIYALALEKSGEVNSNEISAILAIDGLGELTDFKELSDFLRSAGCNAPIPKERFWNEALAILDRGASLNIHAFSKISSSYPRYLKEIHNAPNVIYVRGAVSSLQKLPGVAVVGARKITPNGKIIAERISSYLASQDWTVVSGLALGVDTHAHYGALSTGKDNSTIAVLAHGLEKPKPATNQRLAYEILESGGVWVSEYPLGTPARPPQFVARNRIQIGLSVGSIIVEADLKSGSITQAKFCIKQKRPLYAVVPEDKNNRLGLLSAGTESIVTNMGANPLFNRSNYPEMHDHFLRQRQLMKSI